MRVRFLTSIASASWSYALGQEVDLPDHDALAFIKGQIVEPVGAVPEQATLDLQADTATAPAPRKRRG